jgi:large subunit ribosomal protein L28
LSDLIQHYKKSLQIFSDGFSGKGGGVMSRICFITGKSQVKGSRIRRRGQTRKSGGIGTHIIKRTRRVFKANLQRVRIVLPSGQVKRVLVCVKAIKAGKIQKVAI